MIGDRLLMRRVVLPSIRSMTGRKTRGSLATTGWASRLYSSDHGKPVTKPAMPLSELARQMQREMMEDDLVDDDDDHAEEDEEPPKLRLDTENFVDGVHMNPRTGEVEGPTKKTGKEPTRYGDWEIQGRVSDF